MNQNTENQNYFYNKSLKDYARNLRNEMTKSEACLWKYALKSKQMNGYTFNRQRPIGNYIVDFLCKELKLVIELDGSSHFLEKYKLRIK